MESQEAFGSTKRAMMSSGREKILVVDSSKFDQTAFFCCRQPEGCRCSCNRQKACGQVEDIL